MPTTTFALRHCLHAALAGAMLSGLARSAAALDLDAAALSKLRTGEPVYAIASDPNESASGRIEAVIDIPAKPAAVWRILTDCALTTKVMDGLKSCKVVASEPGGAADVREHNIAWSRFLPSVRSVFRSEYVPEREIRFKRADGDLKRLEGSWRIEPAADGSGLRLHYAASLALGVPVPSYLVRSALESDIPRTLKAIRKAAIDGLGG